jgi:hypothetical protein
MILVLLGIYVVKLFILFCWFLALIFWSLFYWPIREFGGFMMITFLNGINQFCWWGNSVIGLEFSEFKHSDQKTFQLKL